MKKKRALLLFGSLAVLVLGYIAWCARPMYLSVPVPELLELPEDVREDARSVIVKHGLSRPDSFRFREFVGLLAKPYDIDPGEIQVAGHSHMLTVTRKRQGVRDYQLPVCFFRFGNGPWKLMCCRQHDGTLHPERPLESITSRPAE